MIEATSPAINSTALPLPKAQKAQATEALPSDKVLRWVKNDRMGGFVPVWEKPSSARGMIEQQLTAAEHSKSPLDNQSALAYQDMSGDSTTTQGEKEFGFRDLLDMVNPLQHIPIVNKIYRNITGDEIRPISTIIGGAVFGGGLGAASALVNVVIEAETGKDLTGNALSLLRREEPAPRFAENTHNARQDKPQAPEQRLTEIENTLNNEGERALREELPASLLAFTTPHNTAGFKGFQLDNIASGRTAGTTLRETNTQDIAIKTKASLTNALSPREPITQFTMRQMLDESTF